MRTALSIACVLSLSACVAPAEPAPTQDTAPGVRYDGFDGPGRGKHVVLVAGDEEYRSEEALPLLARILAVHHGFRCTLLFSTDPETGVIDPDRRDHLPGLEALEDADLLVLFTRFRELPDEDMRYLVDFVESGRPLVGLRTATHAFAYGEGSPSRYAHWRWNDADCPGGFGRQVLGETWVNHHGRHGSESTAGVLVRPEHPILRGVQSIWGPTDVYGIRDLPDDAKVLVEGAVLAGMEPSSAPVTDGRNDPRMPIVWVRERALEGGGTQRVVASTIGAATDLESEGLRRTLVNAVYWGLAMEAAISSASVVDPVGETEPTSFGFGGARPGVKPEDHALR